MTALSGAFGWLFAFALLLGVLIAVHELGHFLAAKFCGVRVLKFSLGFGAPIGFGRYRMRWERGGTEYVIGWIPLGGFVKMLGEQPGEEESSEARAAYHETLGSKKTWQKLLIVFAGPAMNLLLPVVVFMGTLWVGIDRPAAIVGTVERDSPAAEAGLRPGDEILAVAGSPVGFWIDVEDEVRGHPGGQLDLRVRRSDEEFSVAIEIAQRAGLDEFRLVSEAPIEREVLLNAASHIVSPMLFGLYQTKPTGGRLSGLVVRRMTKRSPIHFFKISSEIIRLPVMMYVRLGLASSVFWRTVVL